MNVLYHHRTRGQEVEGVHIRGIVNGLRQLGHRVDIVSPPGVEVDHGPTAVAANDPPKANGTPEANGVPKKSAWSLLSRNAPELMFEGAELAYNAYAWPAIESQMVRRRYQLLYERYALFTVAGVMAARAHRVPLILEVNDSAVVNRIRPLKMRAAARRVERYVWNRADAIVTITSYFRDLIIEAGVPEERVHVIANAVDENAFASAEDGSARTRLGLDGKVVIGYVGAMNHWRRLDLLIEAFAALSHKHPSAHLLLIGEGPDRAEIADRARSLGLESRVTFTGRVAHREIPSHLAALDVAVIPHSNAYGSPMKLFEYMAAGKATLAPWLPPIVSVIGYDDGGLLFAPLDGKSMERALDRVLSEPAWRVQLGVRAREKALSEYVWNRHAQTIMELFSKIDATALKRREAR